MAPAAALLGAAMASALVLMELGLTGPVGPGPVAFWVGTALGLLFPGIPSAFLAWTIGRIRPLGAAGALLLGAAFTWALLPSDPVAWALAGVASIAVWTVPARAHAGLLAALAGVHALAHLRLPTHDPTAEMPSIVLVTLAGVGETAELPALDRLATTGVRFLDATTPVAHEATSVRILLEGRAPWEPLGAATAVDLAQEQGRGTAAFLPEPMGGVQLDRVDHEDTWLVGARYLPVGRLLGPRAVRRADMTVDRALWWMHRQQRPFFAWVHLGDLTQPLEPPPPFDERFGAGSADPVTQCALDVPLPTSWAEVDRRYRGTIAFIDHALERLIDGTRRAQPDVVFVVVGTHGLDVQAGAACGELTGTDVDWRVPLVVAGGEWPSARQVSGPIETHAAAVGVLTGEGPLWEAATRGQSGQSASRSLTPLPTGWVASAGNDRGRATVGAVQAWTVQSSTLPEQAVRSLLEAQARRALLSVSDVDPSGPPQ